MNVLSEIKQMTISEKLMTMEQLWNELKSSDDGVTSPKWHKDVLLEREHNETYTDWNDAKRMIRNSIR